MKTSNASLALSGVGISLIKATESYMDKLPNGDCRAYLCPSKVWTIGEGITGQDIVKGLVWTREKATQEFSSRMIEYEDGVKQNVTVDLNQNEYDALVSLTYNIGVGGLSKSTVLRKLNKGDRRGAAKAFKMWNKGGRPKRRVLRGLVDRRAREATLFLTPVDSADLGAMPQEVSESSAPVPTSAKIAAGTAAGAAAINAPPDGVLDTVTNVTAWQSLMNSVIPALQYGASNWPWILAACGLYAAVAHGLPWVGRRKSA